MGSREGRVEGGEGRLDESIENVCHLWLTLTGRLQRQTSFDRQYRFQMVRLFSILYRIMSSKIIKAQSSISLATSFLPSIIFLHIRTYSITAVSLLNTKVSKLSTKSTRIRVW